MSLKFGYTIIYVPDVAKALNFYQRAFGLSQKFMHESADYGELNTGEITLAFAAISLAEVNLPDGYIAASPTSRPLGFEIAFVTETVQKAYDQAIQAGATALHPPTVKPWGQTVALVRCPDGIIVELCSPIGASS